MLTFLTLFKQLPGLNYSGFTQKSSGKNVMDQYAHIYRNKAIGT